MLIYAIYLPTENLEALKNPFNMWNVEELVSKEMLNMEYLEKNLSEQPRPMATFNITSGIRAPVRRTYNGIAPCIA